MATKKSRAATKKSKSREWSRAFTPRKGKVRQINVSHVPAGLQIRFAAKCKRLNKSQRNLILGWVRNWTEGRRPDVEDVAGEDVATDVQEQEPDENVNGDSSDDHEHVLG